MVGKNGTEWQRRSGPRNGRRSAFTLVELLVVVSIIALLISILLPSLKRARDQAKQTKCLANLHAIYTALICYSSDFHQELPGFYTMGGWGFRAAPGRTFKWKPTDGGYPEAYGLQAVLHNGGQPVIMPNGLARYEKRSPVYLPGDSDVWLCPANQGPLDFEDKWTTIGNTYFYRTVNPDSGTDDAPTDAQPQAAAKKNPLVYNIDWLNKTSLLGSLNLLVMDNYIYYPGSSGMGRPAKPSEYTVPSTPKDLHRPPHSLPIASKSPSKAWCAAYADGHCQINAFNH
jgi:prepilin-type N-terminal cleavage/methylation domain-containing protein